MAKKTVQKKEVPAKEAPVKEAPVKEIQQDKPAPMIAAPEHKSTGFGIASLVLGILSIITPFIGLVFGILGIVFALKQNHVFKNNISTGGFVTSIVGTCIWGLFIILGLIWLAVVGSFMGMM